MSDTTTGPTAPEPVTPPEASPTHVVHPPVNPYLAPQNPYAAPQNPYSAPASPGYQPVPTVPPPAHVTPYSTAGAAYAYAPRTNPLAIVSLVLSLVGILTWITAIGGVITGHISLAQIKRTGEGGRGMALAGVIVGYVMVGFMVMYVLFMVFVFAGLGIFGSSYSSY